jgi:MFS family permease
MSLPISPFAFRDFNLHYISRLCVTLGVQMFAVAIGWHVYELTGDPFSIGLVGLFQFIPSLLLVLHAGHLADVFDRARILTATSILAACASGLLLLATLFSFESSWVIYAAAAMLGAVRILSAPAAKAILSNIVPEESFGKAIAVSASAFQIATIMGPVLAGAAIALGMGAVYGCSMLLLVISAIANANIRTRTHRERRAATLEDLLAGAKFIFKRPILLGAISLDLFAVLFGGIVALLPVFAKDILHVGGEGLGFLRSAPAVGAAIMSVVLARVGLKRHAGPWMLLSVVVFGFCTIAFGLSTDFTLSLLLLVLLGAADMVSVYVRTHLAQANTPDDMRGRVASVSMFFITASNELGDFESGLMASWLGTSPAVVVGGFLSLAVAGLIAWKIPSLRKLDRLEEAR